MFPSNGGTAPCVLNNSFLEFPVKTIPFEIRGTSPIVPSNFDRAMAQLLDKPVDPPSKQNTVARGPNGRDIVIPSGLLLGALKEAARDLQPGLRGTINRSAVGKRITLVETHLPLLKRNGKPITSFKLRKIGEIGEGRQVEAPLVMEWTIRGTFQIANVINEADVLRALAHLGRRFGLGNLRSTSKGRFMVTKWNGLPVEGDRTISHIEAAQRLGDVNRQMGIGIDRMDLYLSMRNQD